VLDGSSAVACSCAPKVRSQDDSAEPYVNNAEHTAPVGVVEPRNGSSGCRAVEGPWVVHMSPKNGCKRSRYHSKIVGGACLGNMTASRTPPQSSRCFPLGNSGEVLEPEAAPDLGCRCVAEAPVPASVSLIWRFREEVDVVLRVSKPNRRDGVLGREVVRPDSVDVEGRPLEVQKTHSGFDHLLHFHG
jgi:hypothetical protein